MNNFKILRAIGFILFVAKDLNYNPGESYYDGKAKLPCPVGSFMSPLANSVGFN